MPSASSPVSASEEKPLSDMSSDVYEPLRVVKNPLQRPKKDIERHVVGALVGGFQWAVQSYMRLCGFEPKDVPSCIGTVRVYDKRSYVARLNTTVVVLHGLGSSAMDYHTLLRGVSAHVSRVVALDLPAHGDSAASGDGSIATMVRAVDEVLDRLKLGSRVVVFGNSMGGFAALLLALHKPTRFSSLVLSSPAGLPMEEKELAGLKELFAVMSHEEARAFVDRILVSPPSGVMRRIFEVAVRNQFDNVEMQKLLHTASVDLFLLEKDIARLESPTHVYWGDQDKVLPSRHKAVWEAMGHPRVHVHGVENAGHVPFLEDCAMVVGWIVKACKEVASKK